MGDGDWTTEAPTIKDVGTIDVQVRATNPNYATATATCQLVVNPAPVTVTADNKSKIYGEADPAFTASVTGLKAGESASLITYTLSRAEGENVGEYTITPAGEATQGNYDVTYEPGKLTITKRKLEITSPDHTWVFDGRPHGDGNATYGGDGLADGDSVSGRTSASILHVEEKTNTFKITSIIKSGGGDVTDNYEISYTYGKLKVTPAPITVTTGSGSKVYDGTPLKGDDESVKPAPSIDGLKAFGTLTTDDAKITATGSQTEVGESKNTYTIQWTEKCLETDYEITTENLGTLSVTDAASLTIFLSGQPETYVYNGTEQVFGDEEGSVYIYWHDAEGKPVPGTPDGVEVGLKEGKVAEVRGTNVGNYAKAVNVNDWEVKKAPADMKIVLQATTPIRLTITHAPATVSVGTYTKVQGEEDPTFTANVGGTYGGDTVAYTIGARQPGDEPGTYNIPVTGAALQGNYEVTFVPGTLTIVAPAPGGVTPEPTEPPTDEIDEPETPLARNTVSTWSLFDLICMLVSVLVSVIMGVTLFKKKEEEEQAEEAEKIVDPDEEEDEKKRKYSKLLGVIPAVAAIITFILTQDLSGLMTIFDKWSILFAAYVLVDGAMAYLTRNKKAEKEEETATV